MNESTDTAQLNLPSKTSRLQWLIGIRMVAVSSMVLPYLGLTEGDSSSRRSVLLLAAITYVLSLLYVAMLKVLPGRVNAQAGVQLTADLCLVTALVYFGSASSAFSALYIVVIAVAAVFLPSRSALGLANLASAMYALLMLSLQHGWIQTADGAPFDSGFVSYNMVVHVVGFNAVALLVSHVSRSMNVAQRKLEEKRQDLARLETFHRDVTASLSSGLATTDENGIVNTINPAGARILGQTAAEINGQLIFEIGICTEEEWTRVSRVSSERGTQREESLLGEGENSRHIGYSVSHLPERGERSRGYIVTFQDVTPFRRLEQELRIRDRMAAVGQLSASMAHEIRNPLAAISGSVQMLSSSLSANGSTSKLFEIIQKESERLDRKIEGFLQFARPKKKTETPFDIANLLRESVQLLKNSDQISQAHRVELDLYQGSSDFVGDADQLRQIFWNLARNAISAMPDGGRLVVHGSAHESGYRIQFKDNGRGMTDEECRPLFQPFTSSFDRGSGLGMAIVYRIVQEHHGEIFLDSEPGTGTTVTIDLPVRSEPISMTA